MHAIQDTIAAISTPPGQGALGIIRVSGPRAIETVSALFSKNLLHAPGYSLHFGRFMDGNDPLDEVLLSLFRGPRSFTRQDTVEISFHGSAYVLRRAMELLMEKGVRPALPGEFTQRAYLNGALDLAQAEAVADLIASGSAAAHKLALEQLRGGVSSELKTLREKLISFTALIELELDFSEEDVEFADRSRLLSLVTDLTGRITTLIGSFRLGNAIRQGVPTAIVGKPNAGKSTLLNALLNDQRAIVSAIPGTTRDVIEDRLVLEGIEFRLMDTAGLRETADVIEAEGVQRSLAKARTAALVLYVFDLSTETEASARAHAASLALPEGAEVLFVANKADLSPLVSAGDDLISLSAATKAGLTALEKAMADTVRRFAASPGEQTVISHARHVFALNKALEALTAVQQGFASGLSGDLVSVEMRAALHYLGEITGEITTDEVLGDIFSKFCIGK